jgi:hypothetical protein
MKFGREKAALLRELVQRGQPVRLQVCGGSMAPALNAGDEVQVCPAAPESIKPGDWVSFEIDGKIASHQVFYSLRFGSGRWLVTKGLANHGFDRPVRWEQVIGRAVKASG